MQLQPISIVSNSEMKKDYKYISSLKGLLYFKPRFKKYLKNKQKHSFKNIKHHITSHIHMCEKHFIGDYFDQKLPMWANIAYLTLLILFHSYCKRASSIHFFIIFLSFPSKSF